MDRSSVRLTTAGQAICHPSALRHAGKGVDAGVRYILILFLNISPQTSLAKHAAANDVE